MREKDGEDLEKVNVPVKEVYSRKRKKKKNVTVLDILFTAKCPEPRTGPTIVQ